MLPLLLQLLLDIDERLDVLLQVRAHHALHRVAIAADDLRQHRLREDRHAARFLLEDDLQQDLARQVLARLGVDDLELGLVEHRADAGIAALRLVVKGGSALCRIGAARKEARPLAAATGRSEVALLLVEWSKMDL